MLNKGGECHMDIIVSPSFHVGHVSTLKWYLYVIVHALKFCPLRSNKTHFCQIYLNPINMRLSHFQDMQIIENTYPEPLKVL